MSMDIHKVATLARIRLEEAESQKLEKDLGEILKYIEKLNELNTDEVEPTSHVLNLENVYRKDEVKKSEVIEKVLDHAPQRDGNFFKVPKVVDKESN